MFLVGAIPSVVYGVLALLLPESPRYLLSTGHHDEARAIFSTLVPEEDVDRQVRDIEQAIEQDQDAAKGTLRGNRFGLKPIVWIGIILSVFQQFVGINVIFYCSRPFGRRSASPRETPC